MITLDTAAWLMACGLALAAGIAALELLCAPRAYADDGPFGWPLLRRELPPALHGLDYLFHARGMRALVLAQLLAALALPFWSSSLPAWLVLATTLLTAIRYRGTYNGGSDSMLVIVALAVALARAAPGSALALGALAYAAAQVVLSYFIAGIAKLQDPAWRRGTALTQLVALPQYRVPPLAARLLGHPAISQLAGHLMLAFELLSPLALLHPIACAVVLAIGAAFHLANALSFGLNRFLWAWLAAYPAVLLFGTR